MENIEGPILFDEFIYRAMGKPKNSSRLGKSEDWFKTIIYYEKGLLGKNEKKYLGLIEKMQKKLEGSCDKFLKMKLNDKEKLEILHLKSIIVDLQNSEDFKNWIEKANNVTERFE